MTIKKTILIIEDNELSLEMVKDLLEIKGFLTLEALLADDGIELAGKHKPDLILMDLNMPVKSGFDACKEIKSDPKLKNIPIIAYTAMAKEVDKKKAYKDGFNGIIIKPININTFPATIESYIKTAQSS